MPVVRQESSGSEPKSFTLQRLLLYVVLESPLTVLFPVSRLPILVPRYNSLSICSQFCFCFPMSILTPLVPAGSHAPWSIGIAVPEDYFYTLSDQITEASGATCKGTTCYNTKGSDFPDLVRPPSRCLIQDSSHTRVLRLRGRFLLCASCGRELVASMHRRSIASLISCGLSSLN